MIGGRGEVTANVAIHRRTSPGGWATAGILIATGSDTFWNLGLVEAPDGLRYTELVEQYHGVNQAQLLGFTRLIPVGNTYGAQWRYGMRYRLRLVLTPEEIEGYVFEEGRPTPIAHWGYLLGNAEGVREGWAVLRCGGFAATFTNVSVNAPRASVTTGAPQYPQGRNGCVGIYMGSDMPGAPKAPNLQYLRATLHKFGFASVLLTSADLTNPAVFSYPQMRFFAGDLRRIPAQAVNPLMGWLRRGGILVSLTAPAFGHMYWRRGDRWLDWNTYVQHAVEASGNQGTPLFRWTHEELADWTQVTGGDAGRARVELKRNAAPMGLDAAEFAVPGFRGGWWSIGRAFGTSPVPPTGKLTCFWAKGDAHTPAMSVEWTEKDGSRWIAVVTLEPKWRFYALSPFAFQYWPDNPSKGRGAPGDTVHLGDVAQIRFGLSFSHTPGVLQEPGDHHVWITAPVMEQAPPSVSTDATVPQVPDLEAVSPGYKLHVIKDAATCRTSQLGAAWGLPRAQFVPVPSLGANERPQGDGFNRNLWWRWVPLMSMLDRAGRNRGAPLSVVISGMLPLPRSAWISLGLTDVADLAKPDLARALAATMLRLARYPVFFEAGAESFLVRPGESLHVGTRISSFATGAVPVQVRFTVKSHGRKIRGTALAAVVSPLQMKALDTKLLGLPAGDYQLDVALECRGILVDRIAQSLLVRPRLSSGPNVRDVAVRRGGRLYLAGAPWHPASCNYWPHYLGGIPGGAYGRSFLDPTLYEPAVVEADLTQMEKWGFQAIAAVGADAPFGSSADEPLLRDLEDFLWRCYAHHVKVFLFVPGLDPRGRNDAKATEIIRFVRHHPAIAGYDIAWEPTYYDLRHSYDEHWRRWLAVQFGSVEHAQEVFGYPLPRNSQGEVVAPSDMQCTAPGPWHDMTAAYFCFMNWQLGAEYRRSYDLVRSLDPIHLIGFRGSVVADPQGFLPVAQPAVLHFMDWAGPEGYFQPFYGRLTAWPLISRNGLVTRMHSFLSGGKPVIWMEFGLPIYPNGTPWKDDLLWIRPERYAYQVAEGRGFWTMMIQSGAWGDFIWWYPGGFRVGENSDCGLVDPDNAPRPVAWVARQFAPKFRASDHFAADRQLLFRPEQNVGGWVGEFRRLRDEYASVVASGHRVDVTTAGAGMTSADCPLIDPAGRQWKGTGPLRYLDAIFERIRIRAGKEPWQSVALPTAPEPVRIVVRGSGPLELEVSAGNIAEARWLAHAGKGTNTGSVALKVSGDLQARAPLVRDTVFQGSGFFGPVKLATQPSGAQLHLRLQLVATNRAAFGEIVDLIVVRE
jgi:hypothetical protein